MNRRTTNNYMSRRNFGDVEENDIQKKWRNVSSFTLGAIFCKIKAHTAIMRMFSHILHFAQISTDFALISDDFARIFTKSKLLGLRLYPCAPDSYISGCVGCVHSQSLSVFNFWKKYQTNMNTFCVSITSAVWNVSLLHIHNAICLKFLKGV